MSFESQRAEIINMGKKLLAEGNIKAVLAFARGDIEDNAIPRFFRSAEDLENMKWDESCTPNLAKYLTEKKEKVAIVAKPCDARAIVMYVVEKQIDRNNVYIIGVECAGMKGKNGMPAPGCDECKTGTPPIFDAVVKNPDSPGTSSGTEETGKMIDKLENSLERFQNEMKKCILCFTCRQACYGCYCKTCFIDRDLPNWRPAEVDTGTKMTFHLGRAMHLAGRCIECGACERACPSGVNVRYLVKEVTDLCRELYGYSAGMDPAETPAIAAFDFGDREVGFVGGEDIGSCCGSKKQD